MEDNLREAWTNIIAADELDAHLDDLGQAKVNAEIIKDMISEYHLPDSSKILLPGCGTGQIFDYLSPRLLKNFKLTFTDINQSFLIKLSERIFHTEITNYRYCVDDLENTKLQETFNGIIIVLVLEQLEWKKAVKTLVNYQPLYIYLIIQEQSHNSETITVNVRSRKSIRLFSEMANPQLVPREELTNLLLKENYKLCKTYEKVVLNNKIMVGLVYKKGN